MNLLEQFKLLFEKKDHLIKKLKNLSHEEKDILIDFFKRKPNLENKIDWLNPELKFDDFKDVMETSKTERKKMVKSSGIAGLTEGKDYLIFPLDKLWVDKYNGERNFDLYGYIPLNHEASKLIASKNIGGCEGQWCTAMNDNKYWKNYTYKGEIVLIYIIKTDKLFNNLKTKYAIAIYPKNDRFEIFNEEDDEMGTSDLYKWTKIDMQEDIFSNPKNMNIIEKARKILQSESNINIYYKYLDVPYKVLPDGSVDVFSNLIWDGKDFEQIPFKINSVEGDISILNCQNLKSLEGLPEKMKGRYLYIISCNSLINLKGMPKYSPYKIKIQDCQNLKSLEGCSELLYGGEIYITTCDELQSLKGISQTDGCKISIVRCGNITSLKGIPFVVNDFECMNNENLTELDDFQGASGYIFMSGNGVDFTEAEIQEAKFKRQQREGILL